MTALALERDMDTLFGNLPIIRRRFKWPPNPNPKPQHN
jgi:hypothetical protein